MITKSGMALLLALCASLAFASGPSAVRKQAEASMLVTGHVLIDADGTVSRWEIDQRDKLPGVVASLVENSASAWRFEPVLVDGKPRAAKARMSLRVVAKKLEIQDQYQISISGAYFGDEAMTPDERQLRDDQIKSVVLTPPSYPSSAAQVGARGTVYVVVQIGRDGVVSDAFAEQVNLRAVGSEMRMAQMREAFGRSAVRAAKTWRFEPPAVGEEADEAFWYVRVPVDYELEGQTVAGYGQWDVYVPGPKQEAPWGSLESLDGFNIPPDALIAGEIYQVGAGRKLLTPLQGG